MPVIALDAGILINKSLIAKSGKASFIEKCV